MLSSTVVELVLCPPWYRQNESFDSIGWSLSVLRCCTNVSVTFDAENSRQFILDVWACLDFCEHAQRTQSVSLVSWQCMLCAREAALEVS